MGVKGSSEKFWRRYIAAGYFTRRELTKPIAKFIKGCKGIGLENVLVSYFDDLIIATRNYRRKEKHENKGRDRREN